MSETGDKPEPDASAAALARELASLRAEIAHLNTRRILALYDRPARLLALQFARGLAFGLGSVVGATLLVSVGVYFLTQIEILPIIGEWAARLANEMREMQEAR